MTIGAGNWKMKPILTAVTPGKGEIISIAPVATTASTPEGSIMARATFGSAEIDVDTITADSVYLVVAFDPAELTKMLLSADVKGLGFEAKIRTRWRRQPGQTTLRPAVSLATITGITAFLGDPTTAQLPTNGGTVDEGTGTLGTVDIVNFDASMTNGTGDGLFAGSPNVDMVTTILFPGDSLLGFANAAAALSWLTVQAANTYKAVWFKIDVEIDSDNFANTADTDLEDSDGYCDIEILGVRLVPNYDSKGKSQRVNANLRAMNDYLATILSTDDGDIEE